MNGERFTCYCEKGKHFFRSESWDETVCFAHKDEDSCGPVDFDRENESQGTNSNQEHVSAASKRAGASAPVLRGAAGPGEIKKAQPHGQTGHQLQLGFY